MTGHAAYVIRHRTGWKRWQAFCPSCPWRSARGSNTDAVTLAEAHRDGRAR